MPYLSLCCKAETWTFICLCGLHLGWLLVKRIFLFQLSQSYNQNVCVKIEKLKILSLSFFFQNTYKSVYAHLELIGGFDKAKFYLIFIKWCLNSCKHFSVLSGWWYWNWFWTSLQFKVEVKRSFWGLEEAGE